MARGRAEGQTGARSARGSTVPSRRRPRPGAARGSGARRGGPRPVSREGPRSPNGDARPTEPPRRLSPARAPARATPDRPHGRAHRAARGRAPPVARGRGGEDHGPSRARDHGPQMATPAPRSRPAASRPPVRRHGQRPTAPMGGRFEPPAAGRRPWLGGEEGRTTARLARGTTVPKWRRPPRATAPPPHPRPCASTDPRPPVDRERGRARRGAVRQGGPGSRHGDAARVAFHPHLPHAARARRGPGSSGAVPP